MNYLSTELCSIRPIWLGIALLLALLFTSWRKKRWPTEREFVELIALAGGLVAAILMFLKCIKSDDGYEPWVLLTGSAVAGLVSVRGIWQIFIKKDAIVDPKKDE